MQYQRLTSNKNKQDHQIQQSSQPMGQESPVEDTNSISHIQQLVQKYQQLGPESNSLKQNRSHSKQLNPRHQEVENSLENPCQVYDGNSLNLAHNYQPSSIFVSQSKGNDKILLVNNADPSKMQIEYADTGADRVLNLTSPCQKVLSDIGKMIKVKDPLGIIGVPQGQADIIANSNGGYFMRQQQFSQSVKYQQAQLTGSLGVSKYQASLMGQHNNRFSQKIKSNMRPLSAKPQQSNYSHQISQKGRDRYLESQTLQNDYQQQEFNQKKLSQFMQRLNSKNQMGSPYMQTIKQAHLQNYGITQNFPKTLQNSNTVTTSISASQNQRFPQDEQKHPRLRKVRPLSSKPTLKSQLNDSNTTSQNIVLNQNSFVSYPGDEYQTSQQAYHQQAVAMSPTNNLAADKSQFFVNLNINQDREQLYKAGITLKKELNKYCNENSQLRTQLQFLQKELSNREKMLSEVIQTGKLQNRSNDNTLLSMKLKQQLREIQQLLRQREAELELAKRNLRATKLEESEITLKTVMEEAQRLRNNLFQSEQRNIQLRIQIQEISQNEDMSSSKLIAKDKNNARSVQINDQAMLELNRVTERVRCLEELLQGKEKEVQIWRTRCEKEIQKSSKLQPGLNDSHSKGIKEKSSKVKEQFVSKDELNHVKQKVTDIQAKYDNLLVENQELLEVRQALEVNNSQLDTKINQLHSQIKKGEQEINQLYNQLKSKDEEIKSLQKSASISASQDKTQISKQLKELSDQHQHHIKSLEQSHKENTQNLLQQIEDLEILIRQTEARANSLALQLEIQESKNQNQVSRQHTQLNGGGIQSDLVNQAQGSIRSSKQLKQQRDNDQVKRIPFVKEEDVKQLYERVKRNFQLHRIPREQIASFLFQDSLENREDITIKEFSSLLFLKFSLEKSEAQNLARFIIEQPTTSQSGLSQLSQMIEFNENKSMMNRRIVKFIQDKVLGTQYQTYSEDQERLAIKKYQELAQNYEEDIEQTLSLYSEDDKGIITVDDLRECLTSYEVFDGRDKQSFECFSLYLLRINYNNTQYLKIKDTIQALFPERTNRNRRLRKSQEEIASNQSSKNQIKSSVTMSHQRISEIQSVKLKSNTRYSVQESQQRALKLSSKDKLQSNFSEEYIEDVVGEQSPNLLSKSSLQEKENHASRLMKSHNEEELMEKSELAFQMIANSLQERNQSLRNMLKSHLYDKKIAILKSHNSESKANLDIEESKLSSDRRNNEAVDKTFEVINAQDFFNQLEIKELNLQLQECVIQVAAKPVANQTNMIFIYKDLEEILSAYGLEDSTKPKNSKNLNYDRLDQKSIRIMNRLAEYVTKISNDQNSEKDINKVLRHQIFKDKIYQKTINNSQLGGKKQFSLEFVRSREFFEILKIQGITKSETPHKNLVEFLNIDSKIYKSGLVFKKIVKLTQECISNEYLKSIGTHRKLREAKLENKLSHDIQEIQEINEEEGEEIVDSVVGSNAMVDEQSQANEKSIEENYEEENFNSEEDKANSPSRNEQITGNIQTNGVLSTFEAERQNGYPKIVEEPRISQLLGQSEHVRTSNASLNSPLKEDRNLKQIVSIDESSEFAFKKKEAESKQNGQTHLDYEEVIVNQYSDSENDESQ